jgi:DNA repair photolyase
VLDGVNHSLTIVTKSSLVLRDRDILSSMARRNLCSVAMSITTLDRDLARVMEPRATTAARRVATVRALAAARVPVRVLAAPIIPQINDHEIEPILQAAAGQGRAAPTSQAADCLASPWPVDRCRVR